MIDLLESQAALIRQHIKPGMILSCASGLRVESISPDLQTISVFDQNANEVRAFDLAAAGEYWFIVYRAKDDDRETIFIHKTSHPHKPGVSYYGAKKWKQKVKT